MSPLLRAHALSALSMRQIAELPNREAIPVVLPTGAIEQHGRHLPVMVDSLMGVAWLEAAAPKIPLGVPWFFAPPVVIGKSNEHTGYPGTLIISRDSLRACLLAQAEALAELGFRVIRILNTHGGNVSVIRYTLPEIRQRFGLDMDLLAARYETGVNPREALYGIHANEVETSYLLALCPELCEMNEATCEWIGSLEDPSPLRPEFAAATYAWQTSDICVSGAMGDATAGTAEKGRRWLDLGSTAVAQAIIAAAGHR